MTSRSNQIYVDSTHKTENHGGKGTDRFEELLAESVYEGLSWVSSLVAPVLDASIQDATTVEIGSRRSRMNIQDCENFEKGLERVFGFGAKVIEYRILQILYSKLELNEHVEQDFSLSDEVKIAKGLYKSKLRG